MCMGLNAAHANYACLYCTVHKSHRFVHYSELIIKYTRRDMSVLPEKYELEKRRSLTSLELCSREKSVDTRLGVINPPLIKIDLQQVSINMHVLILRIA